MTHIIYHPDIFLHDAHAEHGAMDSQRIARVFEAVSAVPGVRLQLAEPATDEQVLRVHSAELWTRLQKRAPTEPGQRYAFDKETEMNQHTLRALRLSAGAMCQGVDAVLDGQATNVFCPVYAGHHATARQAFGFCFTNQVAIGAAHALARGVDRIAILDFDTHSGNGTILSFINEPRVLFAETYQRGFPPPFMPGYKPANILRRKVAAPFQFRDAWQGMLPQIAAFAPELVLVSAGFDAHMADPLGEIQLLDRDYEELAAAIVKISPKIVACLEGGYHAAATPRCAAILVQALQRCE